MFKWHGPFHRRAFSKARKFALTTTAWWNNESVLYASRSTLVGIHKLKLESESKLPFTPWQHLLACAEGEVGIRRSCFHRRGVLTIKNIKELKEHVQLKALTQIESFSESHVEVNVSRRGKSISSRDQVDAIKRAIAIWIDVSTGATEVKSALRSKDAAELNLPRQSQ